MTDKELIKQEIERLKTQNETYLDKEYAESTKWYKHGAYDICNVILSFIDSLPEDSNVKNEDSSDECPCCGWSLDSDGCCSSCGYGRK